MKCLAASCPLFLLLLWWAPRVAADPLPAGPTGHAPGSAPAVVPLIITGTDRLSTSQVRQAAGVPPANPATQQAWAVGAIQRIVALYKKQGYSHARAWSRMTRQGPQIDVDEGRVHLTFVGADDFSSFLYRVDFLLVGRVYHRPTVLSALDEVKTKYRLTNAYHEVHQGYPLELNGLSQAVPRRTLKIYLIRAETFGFKPAVSVSPTWGMTFSLGYHKKLLLLGDDRFSALAEMALPYRQFIVQQEPEAQWVHGLLGLNYRLPRVWSRRLAGQLNISTAVSRYARIEDLGQEFLTFKVDLFPGLALFLPSSLTLQLGVAMDHTRVFDLSEVAEGQEPRQTDEELDRTRYLGRVELTKIFAGDTLRLDQRNKMQLRLDVGGTAGGDWLIDVRGSGQMVVHLGRHDLILRARAVFMAGGVKFWDEVELAGDYLRCYFDDRYWVREALQLTVDFRYAIGRWFKLGVFHDLSGFFDRTDHADTTLAAANAFGPGLHFLIFDLFSLDVYYAFGFSPDGFDHNISLSLQRAF